MATSNSRLAIRCIPKGIRSYNFHLEGDGRQADLTFEWLAEEGLIEIDREVHEVRKDGALSGHWILESGGRTVASAQKSSVITRTFELEDSEARLTLRARSALGRSFRVEESGRGVAIIRPDHPFTRRATIHAGSNPITFTTLVFAFWLVVLMWRRGDSSGT